MKGERTLPCSRLALCYRHRYPVRPQNSDEKGFTCLNRRTLVSRALCLAAAPQLWGCDSKTGSRPKTLATEGSALVDSVNQEAWSARYSSNFDSEENPLSVHGAWSNGGIDGRDWQDVQSKGGLAFGTGVSVGYDDCIACLRGFKSRKHFIQAIVYRRAGYRPLANQEIELLLGWSIEPGAASGYELNFGFDNDVQAVRWNGPPNDFTVLGASHSNIDDPKGWATHASGPRLRGGVVNGDILTAVFDSTEGAPSIVLYRNGREVFRVRDETEYAVRRGSPGIGFFVRPSSNADLSGYCLAGVSAGFVR